MLILMDKYTETTAGTNQKLFNWHYSWELFPLYKYYEEDKKCQDSGEKASAECEKDQAEEEEKNLNTTQWQEEA